jgi:hypothetical protein
VSGNVTRAGSLVRPDDEFDFACALGEAPVRRCTAKEAPQFVLKRPNSVG